MITKCENIIIGAGAAGLAMTALLEKKGQSCILLEAHSLPGGCSSFFERDGLHFDAGATTLSGIAPERPLGKLFKELNIHPLLFKADPGIIFSFDNKSIYRHADHQKWIRELEEKFPAIDHQKIWNKLASLEAMGWKLADEFKILPVRKKSDWFKFIKVNPLLTLKAASPFFSNLQSYLELDQISVSDYRALLDEILFITAQNTASTTPALIGAMGLMYPSDTAVMKDGMKGFSELLASHCSDIRYRNKVTSITRDRGIYRVETNKETFESLRVFSTIPYWNHAELFTDKTIKKYFESHAPKKENCWSAFMLYLKVVDKDLPGLFYQVHTDSIPNCHTHSFFVSFSLPQNGYRSVTISTHTKSEDWMNLDRERYKTKKAETAEYILQKFCERLPYQREEIEKVISGSPSTFIRYTSRMNGLVGGIPHSTARSLSDLLISHSPYNDFYLLGDTQYPGQGIASVIMGALNLAEKIN